MSLRNLIAEIHRTYSESVLVLSTYVRHIDRAIQKIQAEHETLVTKLVAVRAGEPDPTEHAPGEKVIELTLEEAEVDVLVKMMKLAQGHTTMYPTLAFRMSYVYLMALFDAYLSDIFEVVIKSRPEMLRSKKQITYEKALEFSSIDDMVEYLAKRELNELSYKSIKDQADYYRDRFGITIADSGVSIETLTELRCRRNLLVHNNGVVNHIYVELVPDTTFKLGDTIPVDSEYFDAAVKSLALVAAFVASALAEKHAK